jgi:peptidyl-prolyl cis-trans isomerase C
MHAGLFIGTQDPKKMSPHHSKLAAFLVAASLAFAPVLAGAEDAVLVRHKDVVVTKADFDAYMERVPPGRQREARADGNRNEKVVDLIFTNRMLAQEARAAGLDKDPVMAKRIEQHVEAFLAQQYSNHLERNAPLPANLEARARELYLANTDRYTEPPRMGLQHVLVDLYGRTREMAIERAREVRAKALAGEDFLALAAAYSNDPGLKANGGFLGFPTQKDLEPVVAEAAFGLKADGEVSEVVESRFGFHILRRTGFKPSFVHKFDDVKAAILESEKANLRGDVPMKRLDAIRRDPETRWDGPAIASLRTELSREELERLQREAARLEAEAKKSTGPAGQPGDPAAGTAPKKY